MQPSELPRAIVDVEMIGMLTSQTGKKRRLWLLEQWAGRTMSPTVEEKAALAGDGQQHVGPYSNLPSGGRKIRQCKANSR